MKKRKNKILEKFKNPTIQKILIIVILCILAFFIAEKSPQSLFHHGQTDIDQSVYQHVANVIKDGGMPYKDTFDHKGPLIYLIYFLGSSIESTHGVWLFELLAVTITVFFLYKIARLTKCSKPASIIATAIAVSPWIGNFYDPAMTEEFALPFCTISLYIFLDLLINNRITALRSILCGFCFGGVLMLRPNMVAIWIIFSIAALIYYLKQKRIKDLFKTIFSFLLGIIIFIIPILIWIIKGGAFNDFVDQYILFNLEYSKVSAQTSLFSTLKFFITPIILSFIPAFYFAFKKRTISTIACLLYLLLSILLCSMSQKLYPHYGIVLIPALIIPLSLTIKCIATEKATNSAKILLVIIIVLSIEPYLNSLSNIIKTARSSHDSMQLDASTTILCNFIESHSSPGDTISVYGNRDILYNLTGRQSASKYSYQTPIVNVRESILDEYLQDISTNKPKIVVIINNRSKSNTVIEKLNSLGYTIVTEDSIKDIENFSIYINE